MSNYSGDVLHIEELSLRYPHGIGWALDGFNLKIDAGEKVALVGPSGSGKSSVARAVLQLLPPGTICKGQLLLSGKDPRLLTESKLREFRGNNIGLVFQDPMTRLNPLMSAGGHLFDLLRTHLPKKNAFWYQHRVEELLEKVGISSDRSSSYPHELSGGMRQRLAIALAIALNPPLVIADEPTTSLDSVVASQVMGEFTNLCKDLGSALLLITHDLAIASRWCDSVVLVDNGAAMEQGSTSQICHAPKSNVGKRLVGAYRKNPFELVPFDLNSSPVLEVNSLRCWHSLSVLPWQVSWLKAVDEVSFSLKRGETLGVVGASGCGKSTLCRALVGLTPSRGGEVKLNGKDLVALKGKYLRDARKLIQMVFQDPLACLNPKMSIGDAIIDPIIMHNSVHKSNANEICRDLLKQVGLDPPEHFQNRFPGQLSGGQQQRVAIARALALNPQVLICDESVSMLDAQIQLEVLHLLRRLQKKLGLAILFITHDLYLASIFCNRIIVLDRGKIIEEGSGSKLISQPKTTITKSLVEASPGL